MSSKKYLGNHGSPLSEKALHRDSDNILNTLLLSCDNDGFTKGLSTENIFKFSKIDLNKLYDGITLLDWMQRQKYIKITYENNKPVYEIIKKKWIKEFQKQKNMHAIDLQYQQDNININSKILRKYQIDLIEIAKNTDKNILIEAPTGSGKTLIGYHIAKNELNNGGSVLFIPT